MTSANRDYWDSVVEEWTAHQRQALWRWHSDAVSSELLRGWLPSQRPARLLETASYAMKRQLCQRLLGRPTSESGTLCQGNGAPGRGDCAAGGC